MKKPEDIPSAVIKAIQSKFPKKSNEIIKDLNWESIMNCYYFSKDKIFFYVETDGYIHD